MTTNPRGTTGTRLPGTPSARERRRRGTRLSPSRMLVWGLVSLLVTGLAVVVYSAGPARADQTGQEPDPSGYTVSVAVQFSGDAAPGGGGGSTRMVAVHPSCWWQPAPGPYTDAAAMLDWYDEVTQGLQTRGMIDQYGPRSVWVDAKDAEAAGDDLSWYRVYCVNPADYKKYNPGVADGGIDPITGTPVGWVTFNFRAFPAGAALPAPLVSPAELARVAHDAMEIPVPDIDRNPKINAAGAPTLVGLPTWFWVTNPASVGGDAGTRTIRAQVGAVWAEVVAKTGGLGLSSPAGSTACSPTRSAVAYAKGVPEGDGCTVEFSQASVAYPAGFPVTATTNWQADWTGSDGTGGGLDPLQRQATVNVPVAEVQNVVTR